MEPELWTRCPEALPRSDDYGWGCDCHGLGRFATLVQIPFGEAVERMLDAWEESWPERAGMEYLLRAALGEGS